MNASDWKNILDKHNIDNDCPYSCSNLHLKQHEFPWFFNNNLLWYLLVRKYTIALKTWQIFGNILSLWEYSTSPYTYCHLHGAESTESHALGLSPLNHHSDSLVHVLLNILQPNPWLICFLPWEPLVSILMLHLSSVLLSTVCHTIHTELWLGWCWCCHSCSLGKFVETVINHFTFLAELVRCIKKIVLIDEAMNSYCSNN